MQIHAVIEGVFRDRVGKKVFTRLNKIAPTTSGDDFYYQCELHESDPRLAQLIAVLEAAGLREWQVEATQDFDREYALGYRRVYEPADFERRRYVQLAPEEAIERLAKAPDGTSVLSEHELELQKGAAFLFNDEDIVVPDRVKRVLEAAAFPGVRLLPTHLANPDGEDGRWDRVGGRWWQLTTPVMAPRRLPDPPSGRRFLDIEPRYRASDLARVEPFDVAVMNKADAAVHPPLIVSKRFYELCTAKKWEAKYTPVQIEEG